MTSNSTPESSDNSGNTSQQFPVAVKIKKPDWARDGYITAAHCDYAIRKAIMKGVDQNSDVDGTFVEKRRTLTIIL